MLGLERNAHSARACSDAPAAAAPASDTATAAAANTLRDTFEHPAPEAVFHPRPRGSARLAVAARAVLVLVVVLVAGPAAGAGAHASSSVGVYPLAGGDLVSLVLRRCTQPLRRAARRRTRRATGREALLVAQTLGSATQTLGWSPANGDCRVVVTNADGSARVHTDLAIGTRLLHLLSFGSGVLAGGVGLYASVRH